MTKFKCKCGYPFELRTQIFQDLNPEIDIRNVLLVFECPKCKILTNTIWVKEQDGKVKPVIVQGESAESKERPYYVG